MADYSRKTDEELQRIYDGGNGGDELSAEFEERGYELDPYFGLWSKKKEVKEEEESGFGSLFLVILGVIVLIASLIGANIIIGYAVNFTKYIWIGFAITLLLMILGKGRSKFLNFIFFLGCLAASTRMFATIIGMVENTDYVTYFFAESTGILDMIKWGFFYAVYIFIVPYIVMKLITAIVRGVSKTNSNKNTTLNY